MTYDEADWRGHNIIVYSPAPVIDLRFLNDKYLGTIIENVGTNDGKKKFGRLVVPG